MEYRLLGKTGLQVPEIGFGCGNVGGLMIRGSRQEQLQAVSRALQLGVNYFDTAPSYGNGLSEANLGTVLQELRPQAIVATKVGLRPEDLDDIPGAVTRSIEESLQRLSRDSVDLLQLHTRVTEGRGTQGGSLGIDDVLGSGGVAEALEAVRSRGLTRFFGFTGLGETPALQRVVASGRFDTIQTYYNLLNPSAGMAVPMGFYGQDFGNLIQEAAGLGMGVVVIRVMAAGALGGAEARQGYASPTVGGGMVPGADYAADQSRAGHLGFLLAGDVHTHAQAAVRFALMNGDVSTILAGYSSNAQMEEAAACSGHGPLHEEAMARLHALWASDFGESSRA